MSKNEPKIIVPDAQEIAEFGGSPELTGPRGSLEAQEGSFPGAGESSQDQPYSIEELTRQVGEWKDKTLRAKAELQNVQRRNAAERTELVRYAYADLARSLLAILSDLERTIHAGGSTSEATALLSGVRLVRDNLLKVLAQFGVEPFDSLHKAFDPTLHEALMQQPSAEHAPGTVIQEYERGYKLHDRVLRPARVVVAATP